MFVFIGYGQQYSRLYVTYMCVLVFTLTCIHVILMCTYVFTHVCISTNGLLITLGALTIHSSARHKSVIGLVASASAVY